MSENPYQSPAPVEAESPEVQAALARIAPVGLAILVFGWVYAVMGALGVLSIGSMIVLMVIRASAAPDSLDAELMIHGLTMIGWNLVAIVIGVLAIVLGRKLRRLDSIRAAYGALALGLVLWPACVLTLPLSLYGFWLLRRPGVKSVLAQRAAARKTAPLAPVLRGEGPGVRG